MDYRFTTFVKARLVCHLTTAPSTVPYVFNEVCESLLIRGLSDCLSVCLSVGVHKSLVMLVTTYVVCLSLSSMEPTCQARLALSSSSPALHYGCQPLGCEKWHISPVEKVPNGHFNSHAQYFDLVTVHPPHKQAEGDSGWSLFASVSLKWVESQWSDDIEATISS